MHRVCKGNSEDEQTTSHGDVVGCRALERSGTLFGVRPAGWDGLNQGAPHTSGWQVMGPAASWKGSPRGDEGCDRACVQQ